MTTKDVLALALDALERIVENGKRINSSQIMVSETVMLEADEAITAIKQAQQAQEPVAIVAEVHMSRYTLEWLNGPLPEGTELYAHKESTK